MKRAYNLCRTILVLLSLTAATLFVVAQNSLPPGSTSEQKSIPTIFKSQATLVEVPAVVTDKAGNHIHGLSRNDFRVLENGKEQKIAVFEEVTATHTRLHAPENPPNSFSNLSISSEKHNVVMVVVLDEINTPFLDQDYGRRQLIKYLAENLNSQQMVALMILGRNGVRRVANFTDDPSSLINALHEISGELPAVSNASIEPEVLTDSRAVDFTNPAQPIPPQMQIDRILRGFVAGQDAVDGRYRQDRAIEDTMRGFLSIALSLSGIPGRKSLVWATGSFPFYFDSLEARPRDPHLSALYERTMEALNDAQASVYPVDVRGLVPESMATAPTYNGENRVPMIMRQKIARSQRLFSTIDNLETFASMTGGRAFYNSNDLTTGLRQAAEDSSSYYLIGYYLNRQSEKPGWWKLRVRLEGRHEEVRAREGFFLGSTTMNADSTHQADVNFALSSPFESTGIPMMVRWNSGGPRVEGSGKKVEFAIVVPANSLIEESDKNSYNIEFIWEAARDGATGQRDGKTLKGTLDAESLAKIRRDGIFYKSFLQLTPGEYKVHFVVRNNLNGRIGSVTAPLTVN